MSPSQTAASMMPPSPQPAGSEPASPVRARGASLGEIRLEFEEAQARFGRAFWVSVGVHGAVILLIIGIAALLPKRVYQAVLPDRLSDQIVWLAEPGPGGGGGGGGNRTPEPPKKAELPGKEKISVPAVKPPEPTPEPPKPE